MKTKTFENPLIPHARMRGLYHALVAARVLAQSQGWPRGLEAPWVATAIDLRPGDLINQSESPGLTDYVRDLGSRAEPRAPTPTQLKQLRTRAGSEPPFAGTARDRMFCAVGQSMSLKSAGRQEVLLAYVQAGDLRPADWKSLLAVVDARSLPLVVVAAPHPSKARLPSLKIPVIPVDAGDPVAIYRVAQESILRARVDGGIAVLECIDCGTDPLELLGGQLVAKGICTPRWIAAVHTRVRALLGSL